VPSEPFDPRTSTRTFRIAISDIAPSLFPRLMARVRSEAPGVMIDWAAESPQTLLAVAEEQMDLAFVASALTLPEGLAHEEGGDIEWATFVRADHPAIESWGPAAWRKWPHVIVQVGNALQSPVTTASDDAARERPIATRVLNFSAVAPLLARTDLIATLPMVVMHEALERYGLRAVPPPFAIAPMPHRFVWSRRLGNDAAIRWLRGLVTACFAEVLAECRHTMNASVRAGRRSPKGGGRRRG